MRSLIIFSFLTMAASKYLLVEVNDDVETVENKGTKDQIDKVDRNPKQICGTSYVGATRIIGGTEIVPHSEPWLVSLCMQKSSCGGCAGTLISQRHVISASHCDQSMYLGYMKNFEYAMVGAHNIRKMDGELVPIKKWMTHKDAQQGTGKLPQGSWLHGIGETLNDISIILLSKNVKFSNHVLPACLPSSGPSSRESNKKGSSVFVSGWGTTKLGYDDEGNVVGMSSSPVPKQVQLELTTEKKCALKQQPINCDYCDREYMLCGYGIKHFNATVIEDSCGGDSGDMSHNASIVSRQDTGACAEKPSLHALNTKGEHHLILSCAEGLDKTHGNYIEFDVPNHDDIMTIESFNSKYCVPDITLCRFHFLFGSLMQTELANSPIAPLTYSEFINEIVVELDTAIFTKKPNDGGFLAPEKKLNEKSCKNILFNLLKGSRFQYLQFVPDESEKQECAQKRRMTNGDDKILETNVHSQCVFYRAKKCGKGLAKITKA